MKKFLAWIVLPALVVVAPLLFFGKIFLSDDAIHFSYPAFEFFASQYLSGLNPHLYLGFPWASSFHYGYFNPVYLAVFKGFDFLTGYSIFLFLGICLGGVFMYLLGRNLRLSPEGAIVATLIYAFSQFSAFWYQSTSITNGLFLLPALCWVICKITSGKRQYAWFLPLFFGYVYVSAHYQFIVMAFVGASVFLLYRLYETYNRDVPFYKNLIPLYIYCAGLLGGMALGWPQISNTLNFFKHITRFDVIRFEYLQVLDLLRYFIPDFNVFKFTRQEFLPYIGLVPLVLILVALVMELRRNRLVFFSALSVLFFFSLMIKFSPTAILLAHLPVFQYFAQPARWLSVINLFLAILAGIGLDTLSQLTSEQVKVVQKYIKRFFYTVGSIFLVANLVFILAGSKILTFIQDYFNTNLFAGTTQLPIEYYHGLIAVLFKQAFYNFSFLNPVVIMLLVVSVCLFVIIKKYQGTGYLPHLLILLITLNLLGSYFATTKFSDASLILKEPELQKFILTKEQDITTFRVFSYLVIDAQYQKISALHPDELEAIEEFSLEGLVGNTNGVSLVGGLEANADKKVQQIVYFYLNNKSDNFEEKIPLLSMLNGKYIVTPYEITSKNLVLSTSTLATKFQVPLYLYENKKVLPRIYLSKKVEYLVPGDDEKNLARVMDPANDFSQLTYIECGTCGGRVNVATAKDMLQITKYENEYIAIDATLDSGRWLVLSNANVMGWSAYVDEKKVEIHPANYVLQAIYVPPGRHVIEFKYETKWW